MKKKEEDDEEEDEDEEDENDDESLENEAEKCKSLPEDEVMTKEHVENDEDEE